MDNLRENLKDLHNKSYSLYKSIKKSYLFKDYKLTFDHIQGDPYAAPSKLRIILNSKQHQIPPVYCNDDIKNKSICDFIHRKLHKLCTEHTKLVSTGKSGIIDIPKPSQVILFRSGVSLDSERLEIRIGIGLPGNGRRIDGKYAVELIYNILPTIVEAIRFSSLDLSKLTTHTETLEDATAIRSLLESNGLVTFIANDSVLPRSSGNSDKPLSNALRFRSCKSYEIELDTPNRGKIRGMGIKKGITLIVGGGFHGKSTLINAIADGIYDHIPADGRELVITNKDSFKVKAEDGRPVAGTNISPFINNLPNNKNTEIFHTQNASGSTSQAANLIESLDAGTKLIIIDEDTSATNFLVRDYRMSLLTPEKSEPITPLINQIVHTSNQIDVSFILVMGGNSQYFEIANHVIQMENYEPYDVIEKVKKISHENPIEPISFTSNEYKTSNSRYKLCDISFTIRDRYRRKIESLKTLIIGEHHIDISYLENFKENGQLLYISDLLYNFKS